MQLSLFARTKNYLNEHLALSFILIFLAHLFFKSLYLDASGFWYDETFGLYFSQQDWGLIKHTSEWDLNPPLYYYFLWIWRHLFGISEYAIRFSSVLFSSLAAGMVFVFSKRFFNTTTALISTLLFTASHEIFFYAHEARCYSIVLFLALSSSFLFFTLLERKSIFASILLGVLDFFLVYTHYLTGLLLLWQALTVVMSGEKVIYKRVGLAFGVSVALSFWRFTYKTIYLIFHHEKSFWLTKPGLSDLKITFFDFFNGEATFLICILVFLTAVALILFSKKARTIMSQHKLRVTYVVLCGAGAILVTFAASSFTPLFLKRYMLFTIPFMFILLGFLISVLSQIIRYVGIAIMGVLFIIGLLQIDLRTPKHMQYREAMPFIKTIQTPQTAVLVQTKALNALFAYYYDKEIFEDFYHFDSLLRARNIYPVSEPGDWSEVDLNKFNRVVLTQTFENMAPHGNDLPTLLSQQFGKEKVITRYEGVTIRIYNK